MDTTEQKRNLETGKVWTTRLLILALALANVFQYMSAIGGRDNEAITSNNTPTEIIAHPSLQRRKLSASENTELVPEKSVVSSGEPGWKPVYVYYGTETLENHDIQKKWHGQRFQDELVMKILKNKENGYFIDLAAHDAVGLSNTYVLERDFGWNGLCVEMNHEYWYGLAKRKCDVVGAVVGHDDDEEITVVLAKKHLAGIEFGGSKRKDRTTRRTASLKSVFEKFNVPKQIDYFSLDVEGAEEFIMNAFPIDDYQFSVLTVERPSKNLTHMLRSKGYALVHYFASWETLWVHNSLDPNALVREYGFIRQQPKDEE